MLAVGRGGRQNMETPLYKAATRGDHTYLRVLNSSSSSLLGVTLVGSNCLHIAAAKGHWQFCHDAAQLNDSLAADTNSLHETPLIVAAKHGHGSVASLLLGICSTREELKHAILIQDIDSSNALHHAFHMWDEELVKKLITVAPKLCEHTNNRNESAMFLAVNGKRTAFALKILEFPNSKHCGPGGQNCLHAAAITGNADLAREIINKRPELATESSSSLSSPVCQAVHYGQTDVLRVFLEHDRDLGYGMTHDGCRSLLEIAAEGGHVAAASVLLEHCSDALYRGIDNSKTCLHTAVQNANVEFPKFILKTPQLRGLVNLGDDKGNTPLHILTGMEKKNAEMVAALLAHKGTDRTMQNNQGTSPLWGLSANINSATSLIWNEVKMLLLRADPGETNSGRVLDRLAMRIYASNKNTKSIAKTFSAVLMIIAGLIATLSFTAMFTPPGGYSSGVGSDGVPILYREPSYQIFLIATTVAFVSSAVAAVMRGLSMTEDNEFFTRYRSVTVALLWLAIVSASLSFSACLFTVLATHLDLLVIGICMIVSLVPVLGLLLIKWPLLKLRCKMGKSFDAGLIDMV